MRLTIFLLTIGCLAAQASGYAQKVNLSVRNTGIESVCLDIKKQTGFFFLYDAAVLKKSGKVSLELKNVDLRDALQQLTSGKALDYKIIDKTVIISETKTSTSVSQEEIIVKGTVKSKEAPGQTDLTMPGVIVTLKGTKKAVATMGNGTYSIQTPANGTLVFSMVGYGTKEVVINGNKVIDVVMVETAGELNEVIITGYGTSETKENQVGSAFQLNRKDLERKPVDRIDRLLEGMVSGLQFEIQDQTTGSIKPRFQTRIRGESSFRGSNEPLWIVDGIPVNTGNETNQILGVETSISPLTYIDPNDIESVTVLKDATATSIYGANGANGVILITTKKGKAGKDMINYSFRTGINLLNNNRFNVLSASEYRELVAESFANSQLTENLVKDSGTSTDWYDAFYRNGQNTVHNLSFSGGNEKTRYYVSGSYYKEKPIVIDNSTQRFSSRINLDQKINSSIDLFFRVGTSYNKNNMFSPGDSYYVNRPIDSPYNPDGSYVMAFYNKLSEAKYNDNLQKAMTVNGSIGGTIKIIPSLSFTTTNGIDYLSINENRYSSIKTWSGRNNAYAYRSQTTNLTWNAQQRLNYNKTFNEIHDISALALIEASSKDRRSLGSTGWGFPNDYIREVTYATNTEGRSSADELTSLSYVGNLQYSLNKKYHLIANYRRDGNSDFGVNVRWAEFKSIGAAWTISKEDFWKINQIDFAKLKLTYGTNGNSRVGAYASKGLYSFDTDYTYNDQPSAIMTTGENSALSWETSYTLNTGISLGLFKRISIDFEYYNKLTKNILDDVDVSRTNGFTGILQNLGTVRNKGFEINLRTNTIVKKDFEWTTTFNLTHNKNKIIKLFNGIPKVGDLTIRSEGYDLSSYYLVRWAGVDPRDGAPMWYDARGNITKEYNVNNRVRVGSESPDVYGGMTNVFQYKEISLSAQLIYSVGGYSYSRLQREAESDGRYIHEDNQSRNQLERWREAGDIALVPKLIMGGNENSGRNSTRFLHQKTSLRLQNISVNYALPKNLLKSIMLSSAAVYFQADNVAFFTPYNTKSGYNDYKNSFNPYPQPLVLSFGVNIGL